MSAPAMAKDEPVGQPSGPCVMVIFGASGDLTKRKLLPALCNLAQEGLLSKEFAVVGVDSLASAGSVLVLCFAFPR